MIHRFTSLSALAGQRADHCWGPYSLRPLRAIAEEIPPDVVYKDDDMAVIDKPAGMSGAVVFSAVAEEVELLSGCD